MPQVTPHPRTVEKLAVVGGKRTEYTFLGVKGLVLDCSPTGQRSWFVRYQVGHGESRQRRNLRLGSFSSKLTDHLTFGQAVDKATDALKSAKQGKDTFIDSHPHRATGDTFDAIYDSWLELYARPNKKSWRDDDGMCHRHGANRSTLFGRAERRAKRQVTWRFQHISHVAFNVGL